MSNPSLTRHHQADVPDLCHVGLDVEHARGVLALIYSALENGDLVATGALEAGSLIAVVRKGIHSARDAEAALDRYPR